MIIYSLLYTLAFLIAAPLLALFSRKSKNYLSSFRQRLGFVKATIIDSRPSIWVHAVSTGEANAAKSLVAELKEKYPEHAIIVSTTTTDGQETARDNLDADDYFFFPFDWRFAIRRVIRRFRPQLCIVMETELWPNFISVLNSRRIPLVLANGRISDRSFGKYRAMRWLFKPLLRKFYALCAQSERDAGRLAEMGAHLFDIVTTGNLKSGQEQYVIDAKKVELLRNRLAIKDDDLIFVAGSTHEGEEQAVFHAFRETESSHPNLRLIIVPRKKERFDQVAAFLKSEKCDFQRFSSEDRHLTKKIVLLDEMHLLQALYTLADVAFVGGSLLPRGGHNLLEASAAGVPVLFGPHMHNFRTVSADVLRHNAGSQVQDESELCNALQQLLDDKQLHAAMSQAALGLFKENQQALSKTLSPIDDALSWFGSRMQPSLINRVLAAIHAAGARLIRKKPEVELRNGLRLDQPVISVGGLSFGGAGKTPMVSLLAQKLIDEKFKVALLTRGYKGAGPDPLIVSDGAGEIAGAKIGGDEPVMLAHKHPRLIVIKDSDRYRGGIHAQELADPDLFLLDDGFQHRRVARDFNVLMLDADSVTAPRTAEQLLREPLSFASTADAIVLLSSTENRRRAAERMLKSMFDIPVFNGHIAATSCFDLKSAENIPTDSLQHMRLSAFCGIAAPHRFTHSLNRLGIDIRSITQFADHYRYTESDILKLAAVLKRLRCDAMITTVKDSYRLKDIQHSIPEDMKILVLEVELEIDNFSELYGAIKSAILE